MRVTLAAFAAMLALAVPARGADKYSWDFVRSGQEVQLSYGVPESDIVTITFRCKTKRIEIVSTVLPRKPKKGQAVRTTLSNGAATAAFDGKFGYTSSEEGFYFIADVPAALKVVAVLKSGTSLTIGIPGKEERVPLKGVAKPLAQFEAACFRSR
jgi:hypothetical protein